MSELKQIPLDLLNLFTFGFITAGLIKLFFGIVIDFLAILIGSLDVI
jgi:hypothetical protein